MADIRISNLTTASASASDDYIGIDGSTNGTRKLSAYSPTFGGNFQANGTGTIGGVLTVSSTTDSSSKDTGAIITEGGLGVEKSASIGGNLTVTGTVNSTSGITTADVTFGSAGPSAKSSIAARAARQGLVFDGTAGATTNVQSIGTGDFTIAAWARSDNSVDYQTIIGGASNSLSFRTVNGGGVTRLLFSLTEVANAPQSTITVPPNKWNLLTLRRSGTNVYYGVNGIEDAAITNTGDFPQPFTYIGRQVTGTIWKGELVPYVFNRALSAAEVVALYEAGVPAKPDYNSASNTAVYSTDFSTSTGWVAESGWSITGGAAVLSGSSAGALYRTATALNPLSRYRITFTVASYVSGGVKPWIQIGSSRVYGTARTANGTYTEELVAPSATGTSYAGIEASTSSSCSLSVDDYAYYAAGLLLAPDAGQVGNGYVWNDVSGNVAQIALPSSGVTWNVPSVAGNRIRGTTNTNGNQQLLGASVLLPAESQILHVRARSRSGTPSITIGTSSGGAEIVASVALSTTWKNLTIALTGGIVSSADDIWIGSNSTDVVETDISWQPLDF